MRIVVYRWKVNGIMLSSIKTHVLFPLMGRVGTAVATMLVPHGVNATYAEQIGIGVTALGLVMFDLTVGYLNRTKGNKNG